MSTRLKMIGRMTRLALAFAALALLGAAGSGAQAPNPKPEVTPAVQMARHFQHEDALYAAKPVTGQTRTAAQAMALHFQHEDALYAAKPVTGQTRTAAQAMALHFQHEDALYRASAPTSGRSALAAQVATSDGFDWNDALVGAGSTIALLLFGAAAMVAIRRSRSRPAQS
jgi:hypothetical protein